MTRYSAAQLVFAFVVVAVGAVKVVRIVVDQIDDATSSLTGLT